MKHIINFSGGKSSAYMLNFIDRKQDNIFIFCNTSKETPETYKFLKNCKEILLKKIYLI